jgi:hypothetical protein
MNRSIRAGAVLAVAIAVVIACGRAPEPSSVPPSSTSAVVPTTATTAEALTAVPVPIGSGAVNTGVNTAVPPTHTHASATTTARPPAVTSKPPPPPPKPPDRWVLGAGDRRSLEQQTGQPFPDFHVDDFYRRICPGHAVCLENAFQVDPKLGEEDIDCLVGGHIIPDPLFEGGTVTWVVNNLCGPA